MIESRYKIEYVLPDEVKTKASPFRVLWYLLLIPLVAIIVTAITYDFSIKNMTRDSLALIEKTKVQVFNLGDEQPASEINATANIVADESAKPTSTKTKNNPENDVMVVKKTPENQEINKDKTTISVLTSKQELQLKTIQKQIAKNTAMTKSLNELSEKLVLEQIKNQELTTQLTEQEKDRLELEEQLNRMLENSEDNKVTLEEFKISNNVLVTQARTAQNEKNTKTVLVKEQANIGSQVIEPITDATENKNQTEKSATDKIIETMTSLDSEKKLKSELTIESKDELIVTETQALLKNKIETEIAQEQETKEKMKGIEEAPLLISDKNSQKQITEAEQPKIKSVVDTNNKVETADSSTQSAIQSPILESSATQKLDIKNTGPKEKTKPVQAITKETSPVDAIIAAMQESKIDSAEQNSENKNATADQ